MREFEISKNPYDEKKNLYSKSAITFYPGLTVLVGCNGSGKTTLLHLLKDQLKEQDIPTMSFNNLTEGGTNKISSLMFWGNIEGGATMMMSSEGERISQSIGYFVTSIGKEIRKNHPKELWVLMDAVGSGLSIDGIDEIKDFVNFIRGEETNTVFYFVVCTNEFEFAYGSDCIDVTTFAHKEFKTYDTYKKFILKTREKKNKRYGV